MRFLLDVNILVAWGWEDHVDHERTSKWIADSIHTKSVVLLTSVIPQLGFVRVSVQRTAGQLAVSQASEVLAHMIQTLGRKHQFLSDDKDCTNWPTWCKSSHQTTDAHLLALAHKHRAQLATLDEGIPGAFVVSK